MKPPADLVPRGRGRRFWRAMTAEYTLRVDEIEVLAESARMLDLLDVLRERVAEDGPVVDGSRGQVVVHPALVELRQVRQELRRTLGQLGIPDEADEEQPGARPALRVVGDAT